MQILLIQSEIEQAIRNYMNQQINIKEGMTLDIDLRSTRGSEGFTANIDIHTAGTAKNVSKPVLSETEPTKSTAATAAMDTKEESTPDQVNESRKTLFGGLKKVVNESVTTTQE